MKSIGLIAAIERVFTRHAMCGLRASSVATWHKPHTFHHSSSVSSFPLSIHTLLQTTLMADHSELINSFVDIVGSTKEQAEFYLEANGWELQVWHIIWTAGQLDESQQGAHLCIIDHRC